MRRKLSRVCMDGMRRQRSLEENGYGAIEETMFLYLFIYITITHPYVFFYYYKLHQVVVYLVSRLRQVVIYLFNDHVAEQAVVGVAASKARIAAAVRQ